MEESSRSERCGFLKKRDVQCAVSFTIAVLCLPVAVIMIVICHTSSTTCSALGLTLLLLSLGCIFYCCYLFKVKCLSKPETELPPNPKMVFVKTKGYRIEFERHDLDVINEVSEVSSSVQSPNTPLTTGMVDVFKFNRLSSSSDFHPLPESLNTSGNNEEKDDRDRLPSIDSVTEPVDASNSESTSAMSPKSEELSDNLRPDDGEIPLSPVSEDKSRGLQFSLIDSDPSGSTLSPPTENVNLSSDVTEERTASQAGDSTDIFDKSSNISIEFSENAAEMLSSPRNTSPIPSPPSSNIEVIPESEINAQKGCGDMSVDCISVDIHPEVTETLDSKPRAESEDVLNTAIVESGGQVNKDAKNTVGNAGNLSNKKSESNKPLERRNTWPVSYQVPTPARKTF